MTLGTRLSHTNNNRIFVTTFRDVLSFINRTIRKTDHLSRLESASVVSPLGSAQSSTLSSRRSSATSSLTRCFSTIVATFPFSLHYHCRYLTSQFYHSRDVFQQQQSQPIQDSRSRLSHPQSQKDALTSSPSGSSITLARTASVHRTSHTADCPPRELLPSNHDEVPAPLCPSDLVSGRHGRAHSIQVRLQLQTHHTSDRDCPSYLRKHDQPEGHLERYDHVQVARPTSRGSPVAGLQQSWLREPFHDER